MNFISTEIEVGSVSVKRGQTLTFAGGIGPVWRVTHGVFKLVRSEEAGVALVQLAKSGDLIGVESLCHKAYQYTVQAIIDSKVEVHTTSHALSDPTTLVQAFLQQQRQTYDMYRLRTGPIGQRLAYLIGLLEFRLDGQVVSIQRTDLPTLKDIASTIDATVETVCRDLNLLIPARPQAKVKAKKKLSSNWAQAGSLGSFQTAAA